MGLCVFSEKYVESKDVIGLERVFFDKYLPAAPPEFVKVYLYGLLICRGGGSARGYADMARLLRLDARTVAEAFRYWENLGLVSAQGEQVIYHSLAELLATHTPPQDLTAYTEFNRALQKLFPNRILQPREYAVAQDWLEILHLPEEVILVMVRHTLENSRKKDISIPYIDYVAREWADHEINTLAKAEEYLLSHGKKADKPVLRLLADLGIRRDATRAEAALYEKWRGEWGFDEKTIRRAAASTVTVRNPSFSHVDEVLSRLRAGGDNKFDIELLRSLGIGRNLTTAAEQELIAKWRDFGFTDEMILLATRKTLTLQNPAVAHVDRILVHWHEKGVTDPDAAEKLWAEETAAKRAARAVSTEKARGLDYAQRPMSEEEIAATATAIKDL